MFLEICCDPSHCVLFGVPERLVHLGDKWCKICDHHLLPSLSRVHFIHAVVLFVQIIMLQLVFQSFYVGILLL